MAYSGEHEEKVPLWRDERFLKIAFQLIVLAIVVGILWVMVGNLNRNLLEQGRRFTFSFLGQEAGFNIGETVVPYKTTDSYWWAFIVGWVNTIRLILVGFVLTTLLGTVAGIASFSENWLVRKLNQVYVEVIRNIPLLLQLFVWYFAVFFGLAPGREEAPLKSFLGVGLISKNGLYFPWPSNSPVAWLGTLVLIVGAIAAFFIWQWRTKLMETQGSSAKPQLIALIAIGVISLLILIFGLGWEFPQIVGSDRNLSAEGGVRISLEYAALLSGLVVYTGAFIAEIVRAGIQSVSKGQWEAAKALGLHSGLVMRLVVLPQALRVIIPSLNSQYMNLAKNSSLALAIGYADIFSTASTSLNQSGRAVEIMLIVAMTYLIINLIISVVMNQLNQAVQLQER